MKQDTYKHYDFLPETKPEDQWHNEPTRSKFAWSRCKIAICTQNLDK